MRVASDDAKRLLHDRLSEVWGSPPGIGRLSAVNHTPVGLRYIAVAFVMFLIGGILAMLMRAQLAWSNLESIDQETYRELFTMHGTTMMFLFAVPILEGISVYLIPKMIGARDLPFPRLGAFTFWCYLFGAILLYSSFLFDLAPRDGWFMYTPLSTKPFSPTKSADFWLLGITFIEISAVLAAIELIVAILKTRAPGMAIHRMPLFVWAILVMAFMIVFGFPPLILGGILLELERTFGLAFYDPARGGHPLLWQHLFWIFGHPEVYIIFLPAAGIVSMVLATFARTPIVGYLWVVLAIVATGFISFMLWVHHMFATGIPLLALSFFSAASMAVAVPTGIQVFAWIATLWRGRPALEVPLLFVLGFLFIFVLGGLTGVMVAVIPFDWQVHDTHFVVAHFHYVLIGGMVFPLFAGIYYWLPLHTGREMSPLVGRWAFWLLFFGFNLTFLPMHWTGLLGLTRRSYTYAEGLGLEYWNALSTIGGFVFTAGVAVLLIDLIVHFRYDKPTARNPWQAGTLEWIARTPITPYVFLSIPHVQSRYPLWEQHHTMREHDEASGYLGSAARGHRETLATAIVTGEPEYVLHLPASSWMPLYAALALATLFIGILAQVYTLAAAGALAAAAIALYWLWGTDRTPAMTIDVGRGLQLPTRSATRHNPGWWFLLIALLAQATLFASLLFAYFFLWTVSAQWPPAGYDPVPPGWPSVAIVLLLASSAVVHRSHRRADAARLRIGLPLAALLVGVYLALEISALALWGANARTSVYPSLVYTVAGVQLLQAAAALVMASFIGLRVRRGYVNAERPLGAHLLALYWHYMVGAGFLAYAVVHLSHRVF